MQLSGHAAAPVASGGAGHTDFLTQHEAAALLRLSTRTLERHRVTGHGPAFVRLGRRVVYRRADLEGWTVENTFRSTSEARL
jgi:hypothetical protein